MFGYIIFFISIFSAFRINNLQKKIHLFFFITVLFSSLRYGIGYDYYGYWNDAANMNDFILSRYELIPKLFLQFAYWIGIPEFFFLLSSVFIGYFFSQGLKVSKYTNDSMMFYICFPLLFMDHLGIIRQGMATAVIFYAITGLKGKFIKQFLFICIACLCHKSAFAAFFLMLPLQKINRTILCFLFLSSFVIGDLIVMLFSDLVQSLPALLSSKYNEYIEQNELLEGQKIKYVLYVITLFFLIFYEKIISLSEDNRYYIASLVLGCCIYIVFININPSIAKRIAMFYFSTSIILVPYIRKILKIPSNIYKVCLLLLLSASIFISTQSVSSRIEDKGIYNHQYPYRTIFQK